MTRKGPSKSADAQFGAGRLDIAKGISQSPRLRPRLNVSSVTE